MRVLSRVTLAAAALLALGSGTPAHAEGVNIDHYQNEDGVVSVVVGVDALPAGTMIDEDAWQVMVDGEPVEVTAETLSSGDVARTTILALDVCQSMTGEPIEAAKAAANAFLDSAPEDVQIGLVTFAGEVDSVVPPTADRATLSAAIESIELSLDTHLYDGVLQSVDLAGDEGSRSVLVLSDGKDRGSASTLEEVRIAAAEAGVVVDVVALDQEPEARALLEEVARASGGQVIDATSPDALTQVFEAQADALASQVLLQFDQPAGAEGDTTIDVSLNVEGQTFSASALANLLPDATVGLDPVKAPGTGLGTGALFGGAIALGVGLAAILAVLFLGDRGRSRAERQIDDYLSAGHPGTATSHRAAMPSQASLRDSAVALSEKMVKGDLESRLNTRLVGGGLSLTAAEWLLLHAGIVVLAGFVGLVLAGGLGMVVFAVMGVIFPWFYLRWKHNRRLRAFNSQLAETLSLIAGGLSAGLSMPQAVDTVVREGHEPMAGELRRALIEQRLGVDITDALDGVASRMESEDFSWVVMAIRIQREVGGNLAEILNTVADTLREREYLRRQVQVLSAEGRLSGYVLGALPIAIFIYMLTLRGEYVRVLYTTTPGVVMLGVACLLWVGGFFAMSRLVKIEV